jgi:hypothetical protein
LAQYYYLVASLPLLFYDSVSIPSHEDFLVTCRQHITPRHYRLLVSAGTTDLQAGVAGCRILDLWRRWEISLRNELVRLRAKNRGSNAESYLVESPGVLAPQAVAREAYAQDSPLQGEDTLNRARWGYLDELEVGHYFDIEKILVYALRLQVLARKALFDADRGRELFDKVYSEIISSVGEN